MSYTHSCTQTQRMHAIKCMQHDKKNVEIKTKLTRSGEKFAFIDPTCFLFESDTNTL